MPRSAYLVILVSLSLLLVGCGNSNTTSASNTPAPTATSNPPSTPPPSGGSGGTAGGSGGSSGGSTGGSGGSGGSGSTAPTQLVLVAANAIQAGATLPDGIWADANYVYFASFDGHLRVMAKNQSGFPMIADVPVSSTLNAVRGDATAVYAAGTAGTLFRFMNQPPFSILSSHSYAGSPLVSLDDVDQSSTGSAIISQGGAESAADAAHVYVSVLNSSDTAMAVSKATGQVNTTYQPNPFDPTVTTVFDRSGAQVGRIKNPATGLTPGSTAMYSQAGVLALFTPGCCGRGVWLYDSSTLAPLGTSGGLILDDFVDSVGIVNNWMVVGTEAGTVDLFDISNKAAIQQGLAPVASIDLRRATGKTAFEAIEIRAVWVERSGNGLRIFAASDWGDQIMSPDYRAALPSFFVIDFK